MKAKHLDVGEMRRVWYEVNRRLSQDNLRYERIYRLTILMVIIETGARTDEVVELTKRDILSDRNQLNISKPAKKSHSRTLSISPELTKFLERLASGLKDHDLLARPIANGSCTKESMKRLIRDEWALVRDVAFDGKNSHLGVHSNRHGMAVGLLTNGANVKEVQMVLGHKSMGSTALYLDYLRQSDVVNIAQRLLFRKT